MHATMSTIAFFLLLILSLHSSNRWMVYAYSAMVNKRFINGYHERQASASSPLPSENLMDEPYLRFEAKSRETITAVVGRPITLSCSAIGVPPPVISWQLNGKIIVDNRENNQVEKSRNVGQQTIQNGVTVASLHLPCIDTTNSNDQYECVAENGYHKMVNKMRVNIVDYGNGTACPMTTSIGGHAPRITMWSDGRFERAGLAVQLYCRASAVPSASIAWFDEEDNLVNERKNFEVLSNGDLLITDTTWDQLGVYTCVASNAFGDDRQGIFFYPTADEPTDDDNNNNINIDRLTN